MKVTAKDLFIKLNPELLLFAIILIFLVCIYTVLGSRKEGFTQMGAPLDWKTATGVPGDTWTRPGFDTTNTYDSWFKPLLNNKGGAVPLPAGELFMFYANKFSPDCCDLPQQYSSSTGCACISPSQMQYLNQRGGNRTYPGDF